MGDGSGNVNGAAANNTNDTASDGGPGAAVDALSRRLGEFRKWCSNEASIKIHPAICVVNGEATDGTRNAPVMAYARGPNSAATPVQAAQGRVGMVDGNAERSLYERTMGCQIWTAREIKKDEVMMACPRSAMITPDLVAASDAGRAILACCESPGEGNTHFWDAFENTAVCEAQITQKMATKPGAQLLVKTLRERDLAEKAFKTATAAVEAPQAHELAKYGSISSRAPFLAFLIHQRFSPQLNPPTMSESNTDLDNAVVAEGESNAFNTAQRIRPQSGTPTTFAPYARTLPSSVSLPICWKRNELALLSGCIPGLQPLQETVATTTQLATEFTALLKAGILTRFPTIFSSGMITWERWVWAAAVFTSRVLPASAYLDKGEERVEEFTRAETQSPADVWNELGVLIPFLDMVNHEVGAACILWQKNIPDDTQKMEEGDSEEPHLPRAIMTKRVKKQQQVYFSYGDDDFSNYKMLVQYGFAQMLNQADAARLGWGLMDAVGQVDPPSDYTSLVRNADKDKNFLVYESNDGQAINEWWSDERLSLLEKEAFPAVENSFMSSLKMGKKMTGAARSDGAYDPILLTASLVSTMPIMDLDKLMTKRKTSENQKSPVTVSKRHQKVLRSYLLFVFTRKLEKLLENLSSGLKFHYGSLNLWTKASEGGIRYVPKESENEEDSRIGWQTFFDRHAYVATMECENSYYALAPDSCVLTLYDGHLQALQASIDGLLDADKFEAGVLKQLEDLGFTIMGGDDASEKASKNGKAGKDDSRRKGEESKKKEEGKSSPKKKNRNKKRSSNVASTGDRPPAIKLHIGNLSYQTTPSDLFEFFARGFGRDNVLECHIPAERNTGRSRGFGFVTLPEQIARQILTSGRKCEVNGRILKIAESNSAGTNKPNRHPEAPPPVSNDRCGVCGYRPKYCVCTNGPSIPGLQMGNNGPPGFGRGPGPGPDYGRDYDYYGRDREMTMTTTGIILAIETETEDTTITTEVVRGATVVIVNGGEIVAEIVEDLQGTVRESALEIVRESAIDPGTFPWRGKGQETRRDPVEDRGVDPVEDPEVVLGSGVIEETGIGTANVAVRAHSMAPLRATEMQASTKEQVVVQVQMELARPILDLMDGSKNLENVEAEVERGAGKEARRNDVAVAAGAHLPVQRALENNVLKILMLMVRSGFF
ncbi:MAG: hypothetical protein SGILL_003562 [Bacillariaceae sp.]